MTELVITYSCSICHIDSKLLILVILTTYLLDTNFRKTLNDFVIGLCIIMIFSFIYIVLIILD